MSYKKFNDYVVEKIKNDPEFAIEYLNSTMEDYVNDNDTEALSLAIKRFALAHGSISEFAEQANINREHLYRLFNSTSTPKIDTFFKIFKALGYCFEAKPIDIKNTDNLKTA